MSGADKPDGAGKATSRTPAAYAGEKSDNPIVPEKSSNKGLGPAETMEGRGLAKGNREPSSAPRTQSRPRALSGLPAIRRVARLDRRARFTALLHHITVELLHESFHALKREAASGVDGVSWRDYEQGLLPRLEALHRRVHTGRYRARPVRRVSIPKADGNERLLGVTALEDKIVQMAVARVLEAIYEEDFLGFSYGFRPGRGQHDALDALSVGIQTRRVRWILDVDIRSFFDSIDHDWMMCSLEHRIADRRILGLIARWLRTGVMENGRRIPARQGTPQGAPISPLLANIYLHYVMDLWGCQWRRRHARGDMIVVRYADDSVLGFESRAEAVRFHRALERRLADFGLTLHPGKTRLLRFGWFAVEDRRKRGEGKPETFDFLGFTHYCSRGRNGRFEVGRKTIRKRMAATLRDIRETLHRRRHEPIQALGCWLGRLYRGHCNYFHVPGNTRQVEAFRREIIGAWMHALRRRGQRHRLTWERLKALARVFIPYPRHLPMHPYPVVRFGVKTQGRSRMR
ncbi:group II intron reverse transcriptase/maturase [Azotobacter armeniacus]